MWWVKASLKPPAPAAWWSLNSLDPRWLPPRRWERELLQEMEHVLDLKLSNSHPIRLQFENPISQFCLLPPAPGMMGHCHFYRVPWVISATDVQFRPPKGSCPLADHLPKSDASVPSRAALRLNRMAAALIPSALAQCSELSAGWQLRPGPFQGIHSQPFLHPPVTKPLHSCSQESPVLT